jgi:Proteasome subunit
MTIVAGFKCKDGIVLAADTQVSYPQSYSYESKIFDLSGRLSCFMAYAGNVPIAKEVKERLQQTVADTVEASQLIGNIKMELKELHTDYFSKAPQKEKDAVTALFCMFADQEWKLYCAWGNRFYPVDRFELLGVGIDTGNAVLEPLYRPELRVEEIAALAAYGLNILKKFVPGCGGESEIYKFEIDLFDESVEKLENVDELERDFIRFENAKNPLMASLWKFDPEKFFEKNLKFFLREVRAIRKKKEKEIMRKHKSYLQKIRKISS